MAADGIGKLLSGVAGIMPTQTVGVSVPTVELTGVAARAAGAAAGGLLIALASCPSWSPSSWPYPARSPWPI